MGRAPLLLVQLSRGPAGEAAWSFVAHRSVMDSVSAALVCNAAVGAAQLVGAGRRTELLALDSCRPAAAAALGGPTINVLPGLSLRVRSPEEHCAAAQRSDAGAGELRTVLVLRASATEPAFASSPAAAAHLAAPATERMWEVLAAALWKATTYARALPAQQLTTLHVEVDVRRLRRAAGSARPLLPSGLLGSAVLPAALTLRAEEVLATPLPALADTVRAAVHAMDAAAAATVAGTAAAVQRSGRRASVPRDPACDLVVTALPAACAGTPGVEVLMLAADEGAAAVTMAAAGTDGAAVSVGLPQVQHVRARLAWAAVLSTGRTPQ